MSRPTRATKYARVVRSASSERNSDMLHGRGYTCSSMRSTERTWRRRIGVTCTFTASVITAPSPGSGPDPVPVDLGVAGPEVHGRELPRCLELLELDAA